MGHWNLGLIYSFHRPSEAANGRTVSQSVSDYSLTVVDATFYCGVWRHGDHQDRSV